MFCVFEKIISSPNSGKEHNKDRSEGIRCV